jgi:tetratricopeptide (TPR) repeat protein
MPTIAEALSIALAHHQAGRLREAEQIYRQILAADSNCADACHLLGCVYHQAGNYPLATDYIGRAVALMPDSAEAHNNLGNALVMQHRREEALPCYQRAIELKPDYADPWSNLGSALQEVGRYEEAVPFFRRALAIKPGFAEAWSNLGNTFQKLDRHQQAVDCYRRALEIKPNFAQANSNLANALHELGKPEDAVAICRKAVDLDPNSADAYNNLGKALLEVGHTQEAERCLTRAIELRPDFAMAHANHAAVMLLHGDFEHGLPEYEWRWKTGQIPVFTFDRPEWNGESLEGRTVLIHVEQGLGDTIQFIRYAPLVKSLGATTLVVSQKFLHPLLARCPGIDRLIAEGEQIPAFDFHVPLLTLMRIFSLTLEAIPTEIPYLFADPALVESWRAKLENIRGFRIGINWRGRPRSHDSTRRDLPLELFESLAQLPGVRLISLQKGFGGENLVPLRLPFPLTDLGDFDTMHGAFMDTAAIMKNLDLVISSDTAVPHLAGALGIPVWLALPLVPNWRWLLDRPDTPWYPTMRLFRQQRLGNWTDVFDEMKASLHQLTTEN